MYGKIFSSIYDGSLYGNWQAIVTFQQMIILCGPDGVVDMTPQALAARTSIPLEVVQAGIAVLEAPDQYSRTPDEGGRRIERLDANRPWGWRIVNYLKYRRMVSAEEKREADRRRVAERRHEERSRAARQEATGCDETRQDATPSDMSPPVAEVAQAEVEVEVEEENLLRKRKAGEAAFARFWSAYPRKADRAKAFQAFRRLDPDEELLARMLEAIGRAKESDQWRRDSGQFVPHATTWLRNERWNDGDPEAVGAGPPTESDTHWLSGLPAVV
jgi:hypothetical protein